MQTVHVSPFGSDANPGTNSLAADPGFVDPENGDFRLKRNANARQSGFSDLPLERMFT